MTNADIYKEQLLEVTRHVHETSKIWEHNPPDPDRQRAWLDVNGDWPAFPEELVEDKNWWEDDLFDWPDLLEQYREDLTKYDPERIESLNEILGRVGCDLFVYRKEAE